MRKLLVKTNQAFEKHICICFGVIFLLFAVCFFVSFIDPFLHKISWFNLVLSVLCDAMAVFFFIASSDEYKYNEIEPPRYFTIDEYGRNIVTTGENLASIIKTPTEKMVKRTITTDEEAKEILEKIEIYYKEKLVSKDDYERVKKQLEAFLKKEEE